ncbi:MAG: GNAT family N-acetyltransferase [Ferruginibacter sp.]
MRRTTFEIKENLFAIGLMTNDEMGTLFPLIEELNPGMQRNIFEERLKEMKANKFNCIGIWHNDTLVACCGFWILIKFYNGKHVEPDNVGVLEQYRNFGLGKILMDFLHDHAKKLNCNYSELNAYVSNYKAHKFYFKDNYKVLGVHFQKTL